MMTQQWRQVRRSHQRDEVKYDLIFMVHYSFGRYYSLTSTTQFVRSSLNYQVKLETLFIASFDPRWNRCRLIVYFYMQFINNFHVSRLHPNDECRGSFLKFVSIYNESIND